jgi:hypothetical protein
VAGRGREGEAAGEDSALEVAAQLAFDVGRDGIAVGIDPPAPRWNKSRD